MEDNKVNKHRHYDMIVAKAANTKLVVFFKSDNDWYFDDTSESIKFYSNVDYFLCLPQHKEACLHWLNGGDVQHNDCDKGWATMENINEPMDADAPIWSKTCRLMTDEQDFRIKPKKVKRWIALCGKFNLCSDLFFTESDAKEFVAAFHPNNKESDWQFIEIEVEE